MEKSGKFRLTSLERNWILYDVGNSAFVLMVATLIPIFFNALAAAGGLSSVEYLAYWGYASSAVTIITAVLSPFWGQCRHEGLQEAHLHTLRLRGHRGLLRHGRGVGVAAVSGHLRHREGGLFGQPSVLRLDAQRRDHSRADGRGVQPGLCVGSTSAAAYPSWSVSALCWGRGASASAR